MRYFDPAMGDAPILGIILFVGKDWTRYFFRGDMDTAGMAAAQFIAANAVHFAPGGRWENGWDAKVIDCEDYQTQEAARDAEITRLDAELLRLNRLASDYGTRDSVAWDKIVGFRVSRAVSWRG